MKKKISIVTPSFNQGQYIEETIDSILSQGYSNLEYIIMDGGSTDNTVEIIKKNEKHLTYWISEKDNGQSHAINKGLKHVTGDIFNWINSDDYLEPGALSHINQVFCSEEIDTLLAATDIISNRVKIRTLAHTPFFQNSLGKTMGVARVNQPGQWWNTKTLHQIGPINHNLRFVMDLDWWYRFLGQIPAPKTHVTSTVVANFRIHDTSKTINETLSFNRERNSYIKSLFSHYQSAEQVSFLDRYCQDTNQDLFGFPEKMNQTQLDSFYNYFLLLLAEEQYANKQHKEAIIILKEISIAKLLPEDRGFFKKLKTRSHFPPFFVDFVRQLKKY